MTMMSTPVFANMIWPSLYIAESMLTWWIILFGIIIEFIFVKIFIKDNYFKSAIMTVVMNTFSAIIGIVMIPISGLIGEIILIPIDLIFALGTFSLPHIIFSYLMAALCNVLIEGLVLKIIFKKEFKKIFLWLYIANVISVAISIIIWI